MIVKKFSNFFMTLIHLQMKKLINSSKPKSKMTGQLRLFGLVNTHPDARIYSVDIRSR